MSFINRVNFMIFYQISSLFTQFRYTETILYSIFACQRSTTIYTNSSSKRFLQSFHSCSSFRVNIGFGSNHSSSYSPILFLFSWNALPTPCSLNPNSFAASPTEVNVLVSPSGDVALSKDWYRFSSHFI